MTVILVLSVFITFLVIDWFKTKAVTVSYRDVREYRGIMYTTPGFGMLGALAQDGGEKIEMPENDYEI